MNTYTSQTNVVLIDGYSNSSNSSSGSPFTCSTSSSDDEASLPSSSDEENAFPKSLQSFEIESKKKRKKHKTVTRSKSMDVSTDFLSERFWYDPIQILNQWRSFWLGANVISWIAVMICTILTLLLLTIGTKPATDDMNNDILNLSETLKTFYKTSPKQRKENAEMARKTLDDFRPQKIKKDWLNLFNCCSKIGVADIAEGESAEEENVENDIVEEIDELNTSIFEPRNYKMKTE